MTFLLFIKETGDPNILAVLFTSPLNPPEGDLQGGGFIIELVVSYQSPLGGYRGHEEPTSFQISS
jgi:hypothetical protein